MPVQRLPRYILLLNDLSKNVISTNQDYGALQKAIENLHSVMIHLNESKRVAENSLKVFEIQQSLAGKTQAIMEPHRIFHSEGNCIIRTSTTKIKSVHYFLFNDMLLLVSPGKSLFNKDEWRVHFQLLLADLTFSVMRYEKGLLITAMTLKIVLILEDTIQMLELLETLQTLKEKIPNVDMNTQQMITTKILPWWISYLQSLLSTYFKLYYVGVVLLLIGVIYWCNFTTLK